MITALFSSIIMTPFYNFHKVELKPAPPAVTVPIPVSSLEFVKNLDALPCKESFYNFCMKVIHIKLFDILSMTCFE